MQDPLGCHVCGVDARNEDVTVAVEPVVTAEIAALPAEEFNRLPRVLKKFFECRVDGCSWIPSEMLESKLQPADGKQAVETQSVKPDTNP